MIGSALRLTSPLVKKQSARGLSTTLKNVGDKLSNFKSAQFTALLPELAPPTPTEIPRAIRDLRTMFSGWRTWTVREACLKTLVATEVACWFFVGECIGKGSLIGYQV